MIVIFEILTLLFIILEYNRLKTIASPFNMLAGIYVALIPVVNIFGTSVGFLKVEDNTLLIFLSFLLVLFLSGYLNRLLIGSSGNTFNYVAVDNKLSNCEYLIFLIYVITLLAYVLNLLQVIAIYGIANTKSHGFGPLAHLGYISRCLMPIVVYYAVKTRRPIYIIACIVHLLALILFQGKYHLFIPVVGSAIIILLTNNKIRIRHIIIATVVMIFGAMGLFILVYSVIPQFIAGERSLTNMLPGIRFSTQHFLHYLCSPFIVSNEFFQNSVYAGIANGFKVIFNPFQRLYEQFFGTKNFYSPVINQWIRVNEKGDGANVGGLFSECVTNIGYFYSYIYIFMLGALIYYFYTKLFIKGKWIITGIYLISMLSLGFFCNYFSLYPNFECFIYCILLDVFIVDKQVKFKL